MPCLAVAAALLGIVGVAAWGSFVRFWPWNLQLTWANYAFADFDAAGWGSVWTSARLAFWTALFGTALVFATAYLLERGPTGGGAALPGLVRFAAAVPGLVLGLA